MSSSFSLEMKLNNKMNTMYVHSELSISRVLEFKFIENKRNTSKTNKQTERRRYN